MEMLKRLFLTALGTAILVGLLIAPPSAAGQPATGPQIRLQVGSFDPLQDQEAELDQPQGVAKTEPGVYLVQFHGPIQEAWKAEVAAAGAELFDYIPDYAFVVRMRADVARRVAALPAVRWVGPYRPAYRISPALQRKLEVGSDPAQPADGPIAARIWTFPGETDDLRRAVQNLGGAVIAATDTAFGGAVRASLPPTALAELAQRPNVRWIEPPIRYRLLNNVARRQNIMDVERVWSLGLFGAGQIVALSDSGLDTGDMETLSADFAGRVVAVHPLGESKTTWNDPVGHGTHVAGSIAGNGSLSGSDPDTHKYTGSFAGMAPEASLVIQAFDVEPLSGEISGLPENMNALFEPAYADGARIHSNSWGGINEEDPDNPYGGYLLDSRQTDEFAWSHPDMTILFAAGNSGTDSLPAERLIPGDGVVDLDSLNVPGTAKNVITIGASESYRPPGSGGMSSATWFLVGFLNFLRPPIVGDLVSDNPQGMAAFSSRGPTDDGRIKPDVIAPGTNILSARSHDPAFAPLLGSWGVYAENENYVYNGGTSMATPLVAGTVALVRQWYVEQQGLPNPSSALIKATLINGAIDLTPGQYGTGSTLEIPPRPNPVEGWGRVNLYRSLVGVPPRVIWFDDHIAGLQTGEQVVYEAGPYELEVVNLAVPLQVTLVWTDYPGSPAAEKQLVNDLDLTVIDPDGREWHGNGIDGDRTNNVEGVEIAQPARGRYRIIVEAHNIPQGPQSYALVVAGGLTREGTEVLYIPFITR